MSEDYQIVLAVGMGLGLAASCGFRIFVPPLVLSAALKFGLVPLSWVNADFASGLSSTPVFVALGVATLVELLAAHIPFVDHALDVLGAPLAIGAGGLLGANIFASIEDPLLRYGLGLIAGGGAAGIVHAGNSALRALTTSTSFGFLNPIFGFLESTASIILSAVSILLPIAAIALCAIIFGTATWLVVKTWRTIRPKRTESN